MIQVITYKQSQRKPKVPENYHHYKISSVREKAKLLGVEILRQVPSLYKLIKLKLDEKSWFLKEGENTEKPKRDGTQAMLGNITTN